VEEVRWYSQADIKAYSKVKTEQWAFAPLAPLAPVASKAEEVP